MITETTKNIAELKYHTAAHPLIRKHNKEGKRPLEFGNKIWATTFVILENLNKKEEIFKNKRVLEIGCGWGLIGIFLAKKYLCQVTASDFDENVLPIVEIQAQANNTSITTKVASFKNLTIESLQNFDIIIGAEVCYSEETSLELIKLIERANKAGVKKIFLADPGRPDFKDLMTFAAKNFSTKLEKLPGSTNGKTTYFLAINLHK